MSDTDAVLAAIDGALADPELPDGMRWSPEPEQAADPAALAFDGETVPQPPQAYERAALDRALHSEDPWARIERVRVAPGRALIDGVLYPPADQGSEWVGVAQPRQQGRASLSLHGSGLSMSIGGQPWEELRERARSWDPDSVAAAASTVSGLAIRAASEAQAQAFYEAVRQRASSSPLSLSEVLALSLVTDPEGTAGALAGIWEEIARAFAPVAEAIAAAARDLGRALQAARPLAPEPAEAEDPRARALRLAQQRGTGPDRQIQHRPRPRRHQL